ncbi:MAG: c-type cytochrome [Janthinobacterium lividum]
MARVAATVAAAAVIVGGVALAWALPAPLPSLPPEIASRTPDPAHGAYLAVAGDCTACHTRPGGAAFAGGVPFVVPMGVVYSTNITPDRTHGIGDYTLPEFIRLMRQGVARDNRRIYPAMPYTAYTKVSDADLQDLYAYFEHSVPAAAEHDFANRIPWPLSIRWPLAFWNKVFLDDTRFQSDPTKPNSWNRGAYLVEGLGHCGTCHTPRGFGFHEKATKDDSPLYLAGAELDGQSPSDLRGNAWTGLGGWNASDIVELLKTARTAHTAIAGQMTEVVANSTQHMHDDDLQAIAIYLKSLSPAPDQHSSFAASDNTYRRIMAGQEDSPGGRMFMDSCSACHRLDGAGYDHAFPQLTGNSTVLHPNSGSLVATILTGARLPSTVDAPSQLAMPAFGWRYSDEEVAELASFVRSAWGNHADAVTADQVRRIRALNNDRSRQR